MEELLKWYWVIFTVPFIFGIIMAISAVFGVGGEHDHHVEVEHGDVDFHADVEHDVEGGDDHHTSLKILTMLGIGKVPISFVITSMSLIFGMTGMLLNKIVGVWFAPFAIPISFVSMSFLTGTFSKAIASVMPQTETYIVSNTDFIGRIGKLSMDTDENFGQVRVEEDGGTIHSLKCKTESGKLPINTAVLITELENGFYIVEPAPDMTI